MTCLLDVLFMISMNRYLIIRSRGYNHCSTVLLMGAWHDGTADLVDEWSHS